MTTGAIHWLTGTTHLPEEDVLDLVHELTGGAEFLVVDGWKWAYQKRYRTVEGIEVLTEPSSPETMPPICVNVPGAGCEFLGAQALQQLSSVLKPTRVDFAWDGVPFSVEEATGWVEAGHTRTRIRSASKHGTLLGNGGSSLSLGSRTSTAEVVVYDRRGPVRLELRLRGERAESAYQVLTADASSWSVAFCGILRGLIDFVDRSATSRADRAPLLPSWENFIAGCERVVVELTGRIVASLDRTVEWLNHQVSKRVYMAHAAGLNLAELLDRGRRRMRRTDRVLLAGWMAGTPG